MTWRRRLGPTGPWLLLALALVFGLLAVTAVALIARAQSGDGSSYIGSRPPPNIAAPDFALRDQSGRVVRMRDLRGKVVLVTFLDTRCTDACPIIGFQLAEALRQLTDERRLIAAVAISVNPRDDTPARVRGYLRRYRLGAGLRYLTGRERALRPVWDAYYVIASLDTGRANVHSAPVRIFDRRGIWVSTLRPEVDLTPASLAHDIREALRAV